MDRTALTYSRAKPQAAHLRKGQRPHAAHLMKGQRPHRITEEKILEPTTESCKRKKSLYEFLLSFRWTYFSQEPNLFNMRKMGEGDSTKFRTYVFKLLIGIPLPHPTNQHEFETMARALAHQ